MTRPENSALIAEARDLDFAAEALRGLRAERKALPCKFLYDRTGSELFERICSIEEYYPARAEIEILRTHGAEIAALLGPGCILVEYGSGSARKTRILLDRLQDPAAYIPVDISRECLEESAGAIRGERPDLEVLPVWADYTGDFPLPAPRAPAGRTAAFFPGSTIGNLEPDEARRFLRSARARLGPGSRFVVGIDLKKDPQVLHAAYNDAAGATAAFNRNILVRMNVELGADFRVDDFAHYAFYNPAEGRIEMHLVSLRDQHARVGGEPIRFREGETIFTEASRKYTFGEFRRLAEDGGYDPVAWWTDRRRLFGVVGMTAR